MADSVEYNIFTRFTFNGERANQAMQQSGQAFSRLRQNAASAKAGVAQMGAGLGQLGRIGMGAAGAFGWLVKQGLDFEKQMQNVRAVMDGGQAEFVLLRERAKQLGSTTKFTAVQAAEGMEQLVRAGLNTKQVMGAISPTLSLAAADNVELGRSAEIVASAMAMFKIKAEDANRVTDTMAYVSKASLSGVTDLAEALKYAGPAAAQAGQSIEDTLGALGMLAQMGIRGSMAGTAFRRSMTELAVGGKEAHKLFGGKQQWLEALTDKDGKMKRFPAIMGAAIEKIKGIKNQAEKLAVINKVFGERGQAALTSFQEGSAQDYKALVTDIGVAAKGTADQMAKTRMGSTLMQWQQFTNTIRVAGINIFTWLQPAIMRVMGPLVSTASKAAQALGDMNNGLTRSAIAAKYGEKVTAVAYGIRTGFQQAGAVLRSFGQTIYGIMVRMSGGSKLNAEQVAAMVTKFITLAAVAGPMILALGAAGSAFSGVFNIVSGGMKILSAFSSIWGIALIGAVYALAGTKKQGESTFEHMARGLKKVTQLAWTLTAPFRWLIEKLGLIPGLIAGIAGVKAAKGGLAVLASRLSQIPGIGGVAGRVLGAAVAQPVFVVNWPPGMGLPGAVLPAAAGAVAPAAVAAAGGIGAGAAFWGALKGGGLVLAGTGGKGAVLASLAGTSLLTAGVVAMAAAPVIAFVSKLKDIYDPKKQAEFRQRLAGEQRAKDRAAMAAEIKRGERDQFGFRNDMVYESELWRKIQTMKEWGGEIRGGSWMGQAWAQKRTPEQQWGFAESTLFPFMKQMSLVAQAGRADWARQQIYKTGISGIETMVGSEANQTELIEKYGFTKEMLDTLRDLKGLAERQAQGIEAGQKVYVTLDGKRIAVATAEVKQESGERSGRVPSPGARRQALEQGR